MDARRIFFLIYLALQIAIPFGQLFRPRPARFAWQMFSGISVPIRVEIKAGNEAHEVNISTVAGNWRSDLDAAKHLPPFLCRRFPEASSVFLYYLDADEPREFECKR